MAYMRLCDLLPELAKKETRTITALDCNAHDIPPGKYSFIEMYCSDKDCDCRRVFIMVMSSVTQRPVAVIVFGWESLEYYAEWYFGKLVDVSKLRGLDDYTIKFLKGPCLDDGSEQSDMAPAILKMAVDELFSNKAYVDRLKQHYKEFRSKVDGNHRSR